MGILYQMYKFGQFLKEKKGFVGMAIHIFMLLKEKAGGLLNPMMIEMQLSNNLKQ